MSSGSRCTNCMRGSFQFSLEAFDLGLELTRARKIFVTWLGLFSLRQSTPLVLVITMPLVVGTSKNLIHSGVARTRDSWLWSILIKCFFFFISGASVIVGEKFDRPEIFLK